MNLCSKTHSGLQSIWHDLNWPKKKLTQIQFDETRTGYEIGAQTKQQLEGAIYSLRYLLEFPIKIPIQLNLLQIRNYISVLQLTKLMYSSDWTKFCSILSRTLVLWVWIYIATVSLLLFLATFIFLSKKTKAFLHYLVIAYTNSVPYFNVHNVFLFTKINTLHSRQDWFKGDYFRLEFYT